MSALPDYLLNLQTRLQQQQSKRSAWKIIEEYCSFFGEEQAIKDLWQLTVGALTSDQVDNLEKGIDRHNLIFFYEYTCLFFRAVNLLNNIHSQKHQVQSETDKKCKSPG